MAVGMKTVETVLHRFPTGVLLMLFHSLVMSHLEYSLLFFFKVSSSLLLSLEKQMNWALKSVFSKTVETVQHRFPTGVLLMLFHALVMSHLEYSLLFFFKVSSSLLLSLEKQMNWALKSVFFVRISSHLMN